MFILQVSKWKHRKPAKLNYIPRKYQSGFTPRLWLQRLFLILFAFFLEVVQLWLHLNEVGKNALKIDLPLHGNIYEMTLLLGGYMDIHPRVSDVIFAFGALCSV